MSYNDDEELKIGDMQAEEDDLDLDADLEGPLDDDVALDDEEEPADEFASLDGSLY